VPATAKRTPLNLKDDRMPKMKTSKTAAKRFPPRPGRAKLRRFAVDCAGPPSFEKKAVHPYPVALAAAMSPRPPRRTKKKIKRLLGRGADPTPTLPETPIPNRKDMSHGQG